MADRLNVATFYINQGYCIHKVLKFAGIHKTTWYRYVNSTGDKRKFNQGRPMPGYSYNKFGNVITDAQIVEKLLELRQQEYFQISCGYKKLKYYLYREYGYIVNKKKVYRLCKENNLLLTKITREKKGRHVSCNRKVTKPNQVWEFDIKYGYIDGENRFFYILVYLDVFSRAIMH